MTVQELLTALETMPNDAQVIVVHPDLRGSALNYITINDDELGKGKVKIYIT